MKRRRFYLLSLIIFPLLFFWKTWIRGLLPIPSDALVGLYHPFRDYFADQSPNGVPYKNFLLTDPVLQQYPWKWLAMEQWKQGKVPWENPYNFSGTPLLANPQAGALYPLNLLFLLGPFQLMWTIYIVLQPILAGLFMFLFLRSLPRRQAGSLLSLRSSLFGGFVWAFSSFSLVWLEWGNIGHAGMWLPLALLAVNKLRITNYELRITKWNLLFLFALLMSFLAGHPQVTLYVLVAAAIYWFVRCGFSKRSFSLFTIHYSLFTVLVGPQLIPTLRFVQSSNRESEQHDVLSREGFFISPKHLVQLVAPDFFGNPSTGNYRGAWNYSEQVIYIGLLPLLLSVFSLISFDPPTAQKVRPFKVRPFSDVRMFALLLIVGSLMFSVRSPIAELPYRLQIPVLRDLQPTRLSFLTTFGISILSALGFHQFLMNPKESFRKLLAITGAVVVILFGFLIVSSKFSPAEKLVSQRNLIFPAVLLVGGIGGVWSIRMIAEGWKMKGSNISLLTAYCLLLPAAFDLFRFGWKFTPFSSIEYLYPVTPTIAFLQSHMGPDDRYMTLDRRILPPNANIMYGLKSIEGYDPLYSKDYSLLIAEMESGQRPSESPNFGRIVRPINFRSLIVEELGVRYVLSLSGVDDPLLTEVFREGETRIYEVGEVDSDTEMTPRI